MTVAPVLSARAHLYTWRNLAITLIALCLLFWVENEKEDKGEKTKTSAKTDIPQTHIKSDQQPSGMPFIRNNFSTPPPPEDEKRKKM